MTNSLILHRAEVGPWPMNAYSLICPDTSEGVLIDPGAEPEVLLGLIEEAEPRAILLTHTHPDHLGALDRLRRRLGVPVWAFDGPHLVDPRADRSFADGDRIPVGRHHLRVHHAPGHIEDQVCLSIEGDRRVIVGDTIFEGGPGRTWSAEDFQTTLETLRRVVLPWPDDTICYPGHGPSFRLGDRRAAIEAFLEREHGDFHGDATWDLHA